METTTNTVQDSLHDTQHDTLGVTSAAQTPAATLQQELPPASTEAERAAQLRKVHKLKCQGHATQGAVARYYPIPAGREAVPQPTEAEREKIFSYTPPRACQVNRLVKCMRSERVQEVTDQDGHVVRIALKPMARDMALSLSLQIEVLKPAKRADYVDQLLNYFMAPNGLGREDHQRSRALLERLEPHHILDLARNCELPVWQDLIAEANEAWGDPKEAQLSLYEREVPERPKAKDANDLIACLSERSALFSEPLRLVLKDLIMILNDGQPAKLRNFMVTVKEMLPLSSKGMVAQLIELGQNFIRGAGIDPLINPKAYEAANGDLHQRLHALVIAPKTKKAATKKVSAKRTSSKARSAAVQTQVAAPSATPSVVAPTVTAVESAQAASAAESTQAASAADSTQAASAADSTQAASAATTSPDTALSTPSEQAASAVATSPDTAPNVAPNAPSAQVTCAQSESTPEPQGLAATPAPQGLDPALRDELAAAELERAAAQLGAPAPEAAPEAAEHSGNNSSDVSAQLEAMAQRAQEQRQKELRRKQHKAERKQRKAARHHK